MEAPGRRWGCLRVKVLLIPSASHLHGSHGDPDAQPPSVGVQTPSSRLLRAPAAVGSLEGQRGCAGLTLLLLAWVGGGSKGEEGGVQGTPRQSHHKITHWSLWEPVALSPRHLVFFFFFWLFSGICCLFGRQSGRQAGDTQGLGGCQHPEPQTATRTAPWCAYVYLHIYLHTPLPPHATQGTRQVAVFLRKEEGSHKKTLRQGCTSC